MEWEAGLQVIDALLCLWQVYLHRETLTRGLLRKKDSLFPRSNRFIADILISKGARYCRWHQVPCHSVFGCS